MTDKRTVFIVLGVFLLVLGISLSACGAGVFWAYGVWGMVTGLLFGFLIGRECPSEEFVHHQKYLEKVVEIYKREEGKGD